VYPLLFTYHLKLYRELDVINALFENGLSALTLRKPDYKVEQVEAFIKGIPEVFHPRIIVQGHFELLNKYNLGGVYVRRMLNEQTPDFIKPQHLTYSFCMELNDLDAMDGKYDRLIFGPVFRSISNPQHYHSKYSQEILASFFRTHHFNSKVLAIGGINEHNAETAFKIGFDGIVSLGAIWTKYLESNNIGQTVKVFEKIREACLQLHN
jgi:thiamine monophosphate synthase